MSKYSHILTHTVTFKYTLVSHRDSETASVSLTEILYNETVKYQFLSHTHTYTQSFKYSQFLSFCPSLKDKHAHLSRLVIRKILVM